MSGDHLRRLPLYLSAPSECGYLPGRSSRSLFVDPDARMTVQLYSQLIHKGFRRSGGVVYRPECDGCSQCLSARVPVARFHMRRRFQRVLKANRDLELVQRSASFTASHYALYRRYLGSRHADSGMAGSSPADYSSFLISAWSDTHFLEIRRQERLMGVAVTDQVLDGLSAVYTFFDPDEPQRSLGTYAILAQLELCRRLGLPYLYLGYWIRDCGKMRYKADFRPLQLFSEGDWREFGADEAIEIRELPGDRTP